MNSQLRKAIPYAWIVAVMSVLGVVAACSSSGPADSDQNETTSTAIPTVTATAVISPAPTARPTITPVPQRTSTPEPTATPASTETPSPTPTATATPPAPASATLEMGRLFAEDDIDFSTLSITSVKAETWDNESLGCPTSGIYYNTAGAPYHGFSYVITNGTTDWEYHSDETDTTLVRCSDIEPITRSTVNITQQDQLDDATKLTLMRRDFSIDDFVVRREMMEDDMRLLISIFDLNTNLSPETPCNTIFRLDFETPSGTTEIEFICEENYKAFDLFWNGLQGNAPIIGKIIGPYLTGDPIPSLPTASP